MKVATLGVMASVVVAFLPLLAHARNDQVISDPVGISRIVHSIPAVQGDLGGRFAAGGMSVDSIRLHTMTKDDVAEDPLRFALGDVELRILTNGEPEATGCKILGSPTFIKRGNRYIPQDRTGVWLLTGKCGLPD